MNICLDTNILLEDAHNLVAFGTENTIILPEVLLDEMDSKKSGFTELAWQAREFARILQKAKRLGTTQHPDYFVTALEVDSTTINVVSLTNYDIPPGLDPKNVNDYKIIRTAQVTNSKLITNDIQCGLKAEAIGLNVEPLRLVDQTEFNFIKTMELTFDQFSQVNNSLVTEIDPDYKHENFNYMFTCPESTQTKLAYVDPTFKLKVMGKEVEKELQRQALPPLNAGQKFFSRAVLDPLNDIIIVESLAGSGKTAQALSSAMKLVGKNSPYNGIVYIRASVSDLEKEEEIGFLPGPQPITSKVSTVNGWKTMGEVKIGDIVSTRNGVNAKILNTKTYENEKVYTITLNDGSTVEAAETHLWKTVVNKSNKLRTTAQILENITKYPNNVHYLPRIEPVEFNECTQPIDPYLIGYLLGDGVLSGSHTRFACSDIDASFTVPHLQLILDSYDCYITKSSNDNVIYTITDGIRGSTNELATQLELLGLRGKKSFQKFIPDVYKYGTIEQRVSLLQGLIDTDGSVRDSGEVMYYTSSKDLAEDVGEVARSLGAYPTTTVRDRRGPIEICGVSANSNHLSYEVRIKGCEFNLARLPRKAKNFKYSLKSRLSISTIEYSRNDTVKCITIDSDEQLYLTDHYIPTHNSPDEKSAPYLHPLNDSLEAIAKKSNSNSKLTGVELDEKIQSDIIMMTNKFNIQAMITLGMRGRTFSDVVIIIDEAQNMSQSSMQKVLTRFGKNCKVIICGSNRQIDHPYVNKYNNGLSVLLNACTRPSDLVYIHGVSLEKVVRSPLAEFAEKTFSK